MDTELTKLIDLTEKLTRDGYLKNQTNEWECVLDAIPECIYITNVNKYVKFINKTLQLHLGLATKDEVYTKTCFSLIGDERCVCEDDKAKSDTIGWCIDPETVFLPKLNGWFKSSIAPIYSKIGKFLGYICVLKKVMERKLAEQDSMERQKMLDTICASLSVGIGIIQKNEITLRFVNETLLKLTGYFEQELIGNSVRKLFVSNTEADRVLGLINESMYINKEASIETVWGAKDGTEIDVLLNIIKVASTSEVVVHAINIIKTKRNQL